MAQQVGCTNIRTDRPSLRRHVPVGEAALNIQFWWRAAAFAGALALRGQAFPAPVAAGDVLPSSLPAELFVEPSDMRAPVLSPMGDALAVLVRGREGRRELVVIDISNPQALKMVEVAHSDNADVFQVRWADNTRLVFDVGHEHESHGDLSSRLTYAVDRDGAHLLRLDHDVAEVLHDGSGDVVAYRTTEGNCTGNAVRWHCEDGFFIPMRLNTRTGFARPLVDAPLPTHPLQWVIDGNGRVLAVETHHAGETALYVPVAGGGPWKELRHFVDYRDNAFTVHGVGADGRVYVTRMSGNDAATRDLYVLDLATGQLSAQPVVDVQGFDFRGSLVDDWHAHRVLGAHYAGDADGTAWFDRDMAALQQRVDGALPGRVNVIDPADCACARQVLVRSWSDRQPTQFYLFDRQDGRLTPIGEARAKIPAARMGRTTFERIRARDGHDLPVYVTRPLGKGPWPAVVLVHGGPFVRGWNWEWDAESQFLASRGYLVVKPEFRGSEGYGVKLFEAGNRQWGLAMQDDIADATIWAAHQGLSDPGRTCILGGSYGGYAALMGLVRYPDLYRCGIAYAAVSDINLKYELWWSDLDDEWKGYGMREIVGDPQKDAGQLAATSPLRQAAKITHPLLLTHGGLDRRVPVDHAQLLRSALEERHAPLTWVFYPDEGHGWSKPANRADWLRRIEAFLAANDGSAPAKP